jgi:hypothetical protein
MITQRQLVAGRNHIAHDNMHRVNHRLAGQQLTVAISTSSLSCRRMKGRLGHLKVLSEWCQPAAGQQQVGRIYDKSKQRSIFFETYFHF